MIRLVGLSALLLTVALIAYRVGYETALVWGEPHLLAEAAKLRVMYWMRVWGVE